MTCVPSCVQPSPSNAHCGACHVTWSGIRGFDRHRRDGACLTPAEIGFVPTSRNDGGMVYGSPSTEAGRARLAALRSSQSAETGSVVPRDTPGDSEGECWHCGDRRGVGQCCTSHGKWLCHRCYRRTHFVDRCGEACSRCTAEGLDPLVRA